MQWLIVLRLKLDSLSHVSDVFCEKRVLRCLALPGILVRDPQVALGDGGDVIRLEGVVGLPRLRLVVGDPCLLQRLKHRHDFSSSIGTFQL